VWLHIFSHKFQAFFRCIPTIYTAICATTLGISLEFYIYWHNVAWMMDISRIFITYHLDQWKLSLATYHQDGFFIIFVIACLCHDCDWKLHVLYCEQLVLKFPWVIPNIYIGKHHLSTCIQTVYTRFSPSLSKYGVYNLSFDCAMHMHSIVCSAPSFNSLCGFVLHLYAVNSPTKWVRRIYTCILFLCTMHIRLVYLYHSSDSYRHLVPCAH